ncbi:MAG: hypothetical protein QOI04_302 [Verrucomicrobiota bacterium]|jgi:hypothetical protein
MKSAGKKWVIAAIIVVIILAIGYFAVSRAINRFLASGTLLRVIDKKTAVILKADAGYLSLSWRGLSVRSDGLLVRGQPHGLTEMRAVNLRAYCSLQNLWQRKWTITRLQASNLEAAYGAAAAAQLENILPRQPELQPQIETTDVLKIDIHETIVPRTEVVWGETPNSVGYFKDVEAHFYPKDKDLDVFGRGGTFRQMGWPEFTVADLRLYYSKQKLAVRSVNLLLGPNGRTTVTGNFDFGENGAMQLDLQAVASPAEPYLKGFWHGKFEGVFEGDTRLEKRFGGGDSPLSAEGALHFTQAKVHDVPTLKQIAAATRHPQFEKPKIDILQGRYRWDGAKLEVGELQIESKGLFRIEGAFSIEKGTIEGKFKVGGAPDVVEAIPGAREKVFTESHDGYLWTTMSLSGPLNHPREDLKERLVAAAKEHFAKGFLAPLFKPGQAAIELLNAIYK